MSNPRSEEERLQLLLTLLKTHCPNELNQGTLLSAVRSADGTDSTLKFWMGCSGLVLTFCFLRHDVRVTWATETFTVSRGALRARLRALATSQPHSLSA